MPMGNFPRGSSLSEDNIFHFGGNFRGGGQTAVGGIFLHAELT